MLVVDIVVVVTCSVKVFECELLWSVTDFPAVCDCLSIEPVVVVVGWGNVTAVDSCFGVTLTVEGAFSVSSPKKWSKRHICDMG